MSQYGWNNLRLKVIIVSQLRIQNGIEFQVWAAKCLQARDATDLGQVGVLASRSWEAERRKSEQ